MRILCRRPTPPTAGATSPRIAATKRFAASRLATVAFAVLFALSSGGAALAQTCTTDADCTDQSKPTCQAGTCASGVPECQSHADCSDPTKPECDHGTCVAECGTDADCLDPSKPTCMAGACGAAPTVCTSDSDCLDPAFPTCVGGTCATTGTCFGDADCFDPAAPFCVSGSCSAGSGVPDHLMCFSVRDPARIKAELELDPPAFGSFDCKIAKKSIELCVPGENIPGPAFDTSSKPAVPIDPIPVGGTPAAASYLCYKLSCDKPFPSEQTVADRYGIRTVEKLKPRRLCVPAEAFTEL